MLGLALAAALVVAAADPGPVVKTTRQTRGPDGNVAVEGVLRAKFCFPAPSGVDAAICIPAGSTVFYTFSVGSSRRPPPPPDAPPPLPPVAVLRAVDASAPFEAFGVTWAKHRPTLPKPDEDAGSRVYSLQVFGNVAEGLLGKELKVGPFTVPAGSAVEVCANGRGLHRAKAPKGKAIDIEGKKVPEIVALREGDDTGRLAGTPSVACEFPVTGWTAVEDGQLSIPPAP